MVKKGAIEVQFNWVFVLIIGVFILSFVFTVIRAQMQTTQAEVDATVRSRFDTVLQQASQTPGTLFSVQLRGTKFTSADSCVDSFYFNDNRNLRIQLEAAFSPKEMDSVQGTFLLWVLPWSMPFRITNFVYLTTPDIVYLLTYKPETEEFAKEINYSRTTMSLPDDMIKEVISYDSLNSKLNALRNLNTRVVYIYDNCDNVNFPSGADSAVCINVKNSTNDMGLDGFGHVRYLYPNNEHHDTYYLGRQSLFGAIFSEDHVQFDCSMQKAYNRMNLLLDVYHFRSLNLSDSNSPGTHECRQLHNDAVTRINSMFNCFNNNNGGYSSKEKCLYHHAFRGINSLSSINQATKLRSCVYVY